MTNFGSTLKGFVMSKNTIMLWVSDALAASLPLTKGFSPVRVWDNDSRSFTDKQDTNEHGLPVWESEALLQTGWQAQLTPVRIRCASATPPKATANPAALMKLMGVQAAAQPSQPVSSDHAATRRAANHG